MNVLELDEFTCEIAADVAEATGARSLDALSPRAPPAPLGRDARRQTLFRTRRRRCGTVTWNRAAQSPGAYAL